MFFDVLNFIKNHYELIGSIILVLISFVLALVKKKPVVDITTWIYKCALEATKIVENSGIIGPKEKLNACVQVVNNMLKVNYPSLDVGLYYKVIVDVIEAILESPHKTK